MRFKNNTFYKVEDLIESALPDFLHDELDVEIKYCPKGTRRIISGTYYRQTAKRADGRLIRIRINRNNRYPVAVNFKTSDYYTKRDGKGREIIYQKMRKESFTCPEHLILAVFLHEFSHYLDHIEGKNGRYKQTKADKFAVARLEDLGVVNKQSGG
jgi:hypothetical protein